MKDRQSRATDRCKDSYSGRASRHITFVMVGMILAVLAGLAPNGLFPKNFFGDLGSTKVVHASTPPTITAMAPESAPTTGGSTITITGTNFVSGGTTVTFGSVPATSVTFVSSTQITAVTPAYPPGEIQVTATTSQGTSGTGLASTFLFVSPGQYVPVTATRICNTQSGTGTQCSGHTLGANGTLTVSVAGYASVPAIASSVWINLSVASPSASSNIIAYPTGLATPTGNTLNTTAGAWMANLVQVPLGSNGQISIWNGLGTVDIVVDVEGYVSPTTGSSGGQMNLLQPNARICDTRTGNSTPCVGAGPFASGSTYTIQATGQGGIPSTGVQAVVIDVTVLPGSSAGWAVVWPYGQSQPATSNISYLASSLITNRVMVPVGTNGKINIYTSAGGMNYVVDANGWTSSAGPSQVGNVLQQQATHRACDTRTGSGYACAGQHLSAGTTQVISLGGLGGLPSAANVLAVALNVAVIPSNGMAGVTLWPDGTSQPSTTDMIVNSQWALANFDAVVGLSSLGKIDIVSGVAADVVIDVEGWYSVPQSQPNSWSSYSLAAGVGDGSVSSPTGQRFGAPVNADSGELYQTHTDFAIPGLGPGLSLTRAYNSASAATNGPFGYGWASNLGMSANIQSTTVTITDESGAPVTFTGSGTTWTGAAYNASTLTTAGSGGSQTWTYTRWNGQKFVFNSTGQLTSEADRNSNTTTLTYSSGNLSTVTDASSRTLTFTWTGSNITKVTDPNSQTVQYAYTSGNLTSVTDQATHLTYYTYDTHHNLLTVQDPNSNTTTFTYSASSPYTVCWMYAGTSANACASAPSGSTTFSYTVPATNNATADVTDPSGNATLYTFNYGLLVQKIRAYGTSLAAGYSYLYDPATLGLVVGVSPAGMITADVRDGAGNVLWETVGSDLSASIGSNGSGPLATTSYTYNSLNEPLTMVSPNGNSPTCTCPSSYRTTYTYDSNGNLLTTTDPLANVVTNTYNSSGEKCWTYVGSSSNACASAPSGASTYGYDSYGNLTSVTDQIGDQTTFTYDILGRKLTQVSPNGNVSGCSCAATYTATFTYNPLNQVCWAYVGTSSNTCTSPPTGSASHTYDNYGNLLTATDPNGNVTTKTYDSQNRLCWTYIGSSSNSCSSPPTGSSSKTYAANSDLLTTTDPNGNVVTSTYNTLDQKCWTYVGSSSNACASAPSGAATYTLDADNNLLSATDPVGNVTTNAFSSDGSPCWSYTGSSSVTGTCATPPPGTPVTSATYDANGSVVQIKDPNGNYMSKAYNADMQLCWSYIGNSSNACASPPSGATVYAYDSRGNVLTVTDPVGNVTTNSYSAANRLCWTLQGSSANACASAPSGSTQHTYDANGNGLTVTDPNGNLTTNTYDSHNRLCWTYQGSSSNVCASPPSSSTQYTYDNNGSLTKLTQPSGAIVTNTYDSHNRLCWTYQGSSSNACASPPSGSAKYTYDSNSNTLTATDTGSNVTTNTYDSHNRLCWSYKGTSSNACGTAPAGSTKYSYDADGHKLSLTYPNGSVVVSQAYNSLSQVCWTLESTSASSNACASAPSGSTTYTYDNVGNLKSEVLPNGVTNSYNYDPANAISSISDMKGGTTIFAATLTRNANEQITKDTSQPSSPNVQYYQYTSKNQVCYEGSANSSACATPPVGAYAYTYDAGGNLTSNKGNIQMFNSQSEVCWAGSIGGSTSCTWMPSGDTSYAYNANGDRTSMVPWSGSATCYSYDSRSVLTQVQTGGGSGCSTPTIVGTYTYDAYGLRTSKTVSGTTTNFNWDYNARLPRLLQETSGSNTTSYIYGPTGLPLEEILPSGSVYYYSHDALGSTRALTDSSGTSQNTYTYDPYGNLTASTGSVQNNLLFTGQYKDSETGFYYLRARYYDPVTAQFMTVDPIVGLTGQRYAYVNGNPINNVDPSGKYCAGVTHGSDGCAMSINGGGQAPVGQTTGGTVCACGVNANSYVPPNWTPPAAPPPSSISITTSGNATVGPAANPAPLAVANYGPGIWSGGTSGETGGCSWCGIAAAAVGSFLLDTLLGGDSKGPMDLPVGSGVARDLSTTAESAAVHGNSYASAAETTLYQLNDANGNLLKFGISNNPAARYTQTFMRDKVMDVLATGSRADMATLERALTERIGGPHNLEPWAGAEYGNYMEIATQILQVPGGR